MIGYTRQVDSVLFDAVELTSAFTGNSVVMDVSGMSKISLDIDYARGAAEASSTLELKIEHSTDGTNWYSLVIDETATLSEITARVWQVGTTAKLNLLVDIAYQLIRVSVKESSVSANEGTVTVVALASGI